MSSLKAKNEVWFVVSTVHFTTCSPHSLAIFLSFKKVADTVSGLDVNY